LTVNAQMMDEVRFWKDKLQKTKPLRTSSWMLILLNPLIADRSNVFERDYQLQIKGFQESLQRTTEEEMLGSGTTLIKRNIKNN